jgi:hypothetical protein
MGAVAMNVRSPGIIENYLAELDKDEHVIAEAAAGYEAAKARLDVGLRRFIALRDFVTEQMGRSPYGYYDRNVPWPEPDFDPFGEGFERGRFRFAGMNIGDAILEVLREELAKYPQNPWLSFENIVERLSEGGLGFPDGVQARAVNAALLKTIGIKRMKEQNQNFYAAEVEPEVADDDDEDGKDAP